MSMSRPVTAPKPSGAQALTVPPQVRNPRPPRRLDPLTACSRLGSAGRPGFWAEVEAAGTPLVDPIPGDDRHCAVTFLWPGDAFLMAGRLAGPPDVEDCRMTRLPGTDVWALTYRLPRDWRGSYAVAPEAGPPTVTGPAAELIAQRRERACALADPADRAALHRWFDALTRARPDPRASEHLPDGTSVASLPDAPPQPWNDRPASTPAGEIGHGVLPSGGLGASHEVWVHHPAGRAPDEPLPLLLVLDGESWWELGLPRTLDALYAAGAVPPLRTVGVAAGPAATRTRELACDDGFVAFLAEDVPAWAASHGAITADPARTIVAGQSLGGLTAVFATIVAPQRFGCALALSGSFWWPNPAGGAEAEWLTDAVTHGAPGHGIHLEVGSDEHVLLGPTRRMRDALRARGDLVGYREFRGGHDRACWRGAFVDGLASLTAGWERA
jgi:enterochelin esterase-like enzyme